MKKVILSSLILLLTGCSTTFIGIAAHPSMDKPEYNGKNPMFIIRGDKEMGAFTGFCEHISSIPDKEDGYGLNMCGIGIKL